jgi:hypothetical protein
MPDVPPLNTFSNSPPNTNVIDADPINANFAALRNAVNDLDDANIAAAGLTNAAIASAAAIALSKLAVRPMVRAYHNAGQAVPTSSAALAFDSERYDTGVAAGFSAMHDTATNNSRLVAPVAGIYSIFFDFTLTNGSGGVATYEFSFRRDDGAVIAKVAPPQISNGVTVSGSLSTEWLLAAGNYVEVMGLASAASVNLAASNAYQCEFGMSFASRAS